MYWFIVFWQYLTIGIFALLVTLVVTNIWQFVIRQQRWKTLPILVFYIMAFLAIVCRETQLIIYAVQKPIQNFLGKVAIIAKLGVGLTHIWMMLELALRIKMSSILDTNPRAKVSKLNKIIDYGQRAVAIFLLVAFFGLLGHAIYLLVNEMNFTSQKFYQTVGWTFFAVFFLMAAVNAFLIYQMKKKDRLLKQEIFGTERKKLLLVLFFFELSYLVRFVWDVFYVYDLTEKGEKTDDYFALITISDAVYMVDGLSFACLLLLHRISFGKQLPEPDFENLLEHRRPSLVLIPVTGLVNDLESESDDAENQLCFENRSMMSPGGLSLNPSSPYSINSSSFVNQKNLNLTQKNDKMIQSQRAKKTDSIEKSRTGTQYIGVKARTFASNLESFRSISAYSHAKD